MKEMGDKNENDIDVKENVVKRKKRISGKKVRFCLTLLQHILLFAAAIAIFVVATGSTVIIDGKGYVLDASDSDKAYEDSELFDMLYGQSVADIIRFGVIRSQLEAGGKFYGKKVIDVTAYNHRDSGIPEQYVTARYYLEDLLKWQQYGGVAYDTQYMTYQELSSFLSDKTMLTIVDPDSKYYNTSDANYMKSNIDNYTFVDGVSANMLSYDGYNGDTYTETEYYDSDEDTQEQVHINVLINRYKTVDGKNVENYTADLPSYNELCQNVSTAMLNLSYNYEEYLSFMDKYDYNNSNIRYYIEKTVGGNTEYYTNMEDIISINDVENRLKNGDIVTVFNDIFSSNDGKCFAKYIYYSPSVMRYESNTSIKENTIRDIVMKYDYAYPEDIKIWIGVDTRYPIEDAIAQGASGYQNYLPYFWQWGVFAVIALVVYLILIVYLTLTTGRETDEAGNTYINLTEFDKVHTEVTIILLAGIIVAFSAAAVFVNELYNNRYRTYLQTIYTNNPVTLAFVIGAAVFVVDVIFCLFYYSFIRRIKARVLWKNSCLRQLIKKGNDWIDKLRMNGNIIVATWMPYCIFVVFNIMMVLVVDINIIGIIIAIILDLIIGVFLYHDAKERQDIVKGIERISEGDFSYQIELSGLHGDNTELAKAVNNIGNGIKNAVEISMKDERMKTELITNVSHDIKTPLTSIINYVDLIKREETDNERIRGYVQVLDEKSQRLKQLIDDLVEASKISSGNISLHFEKINLTELLNQTIGEFSEKFEEKGLSIVMSGNASNVIIEADSKSIWRVIENLFNNVYKYALERTRVYVSINLIAKDGGQLSEKVEITIKNISASELNCNPEELTERFKRGDESRTTEGNGLGLSIAKNLTEAQHGTFEIQLDGDLFKVILIFPVMQ
ncbi:MAG: HAMP domain-containing histidine kinase [Lachnospiraceae bacterium]|nr:HAMP domain-containing histidine kinase [Lachnospiraceae bacterium]